MTPSRAFLCFLLMLCLSAVSLSAQGDGGAKGIPESAIAPLQVELAALKTSRKSSSSKRRTCKGIIRKAKALINAQSTAPNRFQLLNLILRAQRQLLTMEKTKRNRDAFFETCQALTKAPDEYSSLRLNAELLLSDRDLSARNANAAERTKALAALVKRYRDTRAELNSLMAAIRATTPLGAYELKDQLVKALSERFASNPTAIAFRRTLIGATRMDIVFSGTFKRLDGKSIVFPYDRLGHPYFAVFWSKGSPQALAKLKQLKKQQVEQPRLFEIYSFNLDELPDAGNSVIKGIGLKCTVLKLPGGVRSETFRTYALRNPSCLRVNHFGHAIVPPSMAVHFKNAEEAKKFFHAAVYDVFAYPRSKDDGHGPAYSSYSRYLSQIQSLLIGDFLVASEEPKPAGQRDANAVNGETLKAIRACFLKEPHRYRLTKAEALARYQKANELCGKAIAAHPKASNLWQVRNCRIIALIGMASISSSPEHFQSAAKEARTTIAPELPMGAEVVARYCLAKETLRKGRDGTKSILDAFVKHCGGDKAGVKAHAAAAVLAIHADSRDLYHRHRTKVIASARPSQGLASLVSFLRNRYHQYYLFRGNPLFYLYSREYRFAERRYMIDVGLTPMAQAMPPLQLKTLDGKTVSLPDKRGDRLTLLLFVEPPASGKAELPGAIYALPGQPTKRNRSPRPSGLLASAYGIAAQNVDNGLQVITVFLSDDVARVKAIRDKYALSGLIAIAPGGLKNPIVNQLGILSADRHVNSFLIRRDGTIAWSKNGIPYQMSGRLTYITTLGWDTQISACAAEAGYRALKKKDYKRALQLFSGTHLRKKGEEAGEATNFLLKRRHATASKWRSSRLHGCALAYLGLKNHDAALIAVDNAIAWHLRKGQFNHDPEKPCSTMIHLLTTKSKILATLGRTTEARAARNKAAMKPTDYPTHYSRIRGFNRPYEAFENRMSKIAKEIE